MIKTKDSTSKIILIVEDDSNILFALSLFLEGEGYTVFGAENGLVALHLLREHGMPHLILLDMVMPVMDGWAFAQEFSALYNDQAPIIITTGAADAEQRARDIGAASWIGKPYDLDDLLKMIQKYER